MEKVIKCRQAKGREKVKDGYEGCDTNESEKMQKVVEGRPA